ncbi:family 43 glycosylhydrolase [Microbacterium sp. NPDC064584]|uniref:glycoside hydrolase family 43 protein n=1 Tax=Microbacterium sp. NPDC064584 TaxID=3155817 RepID=UPI003426BCE8
MGRYRNPILPGCHPDPSICRVGDEYFLVTSTFEYLPGLPVHRSTNLVDWEPIGHAIERSDQLDLSGLRSSCGLFAPTIRHHDGTFFVVCTVVAGAAGDAEEWGGRTGHFVVTATDPRGPWSDPIWLAGEGEIDPSLAFDDGRVWLCGTRLAQPGLWHHQTEVWLRELDPETFAVIGDEHVLWHGAVEGAVWAEGPHLYRHPEGGWMLLASEGGTFGEHAISVAYADEITGPYRGDRGNPRLTHRDLGARTDIWAVGHADLVDAADGRTWAVLLATGLRPDGGDSLLGRQTHLVPVDWEGGSPLFAPGVGRVQGEVDAEGVPDQVVGPDSFDDDFDGSLGLAWTGVRRMPHTFADTAVRPGFVRLRGGGEPTGLEDQSFLGRRLPAERVEARAVLELSGAGRGGILLRVGDERHLEVSVDDTGLARAVLVTGDGRAVFGEAAVDAGAPVEIALRIDGADAEAVVSGASLGTADLRGLSPVAAASFLGAWIGPFAAGEGHVDVDGLELRVLS